MKLSETVELMNSTDYKDRLKAECLQLVIRMKGLKAIIGQYDKGTLSFKPTVSKAMLKHQYDAMFAYFAVLRYRGTLEGVEMPSNAELYA